MADAATPPTAESTAAAAVPKPNAKPEVKHTKPVRPPNPIWKMMGLPNLPKRLPSRNWSIFLALTGSLTGAIIYDKREKNRAQRKWCKLVEHLALEPLDPRAMPRRLTVFLEAPPADGLRLAQDHFKDYVKPVLVASGLDWDFIQGRKEGDVRAELAEKIRKLRLPPGEIPEDEEPALRIRRQNGTKDFEGPQGDIVIGRNTWKEYIRGLHEGWLGPMSDPKPDIDQEDTTAKVEEIKTADGITLLSEPRDAEPTSETTTEGEAEKPKKSAQSKPFISTADYAQAQAPANLPSVLDPSVPIEFPHILGFFNTLVRLKWFLNRRELADSIGRDVAAIVLATARPYEEISGAAPTSFEADSPTTDSPQISSTSEQALALIREEKNWHKSIKKHTDDEPERTWLNEVVIDPRIASRMLKAELTPEDEARAAKIVVPEEEIEGWIKGLLRAGYRSGKDYFVGEAKKGPNVGNLDEDSVE